MKEPRGVVQRIVADPIRTQWLHATLAPSPARPGEYEWSDTKAGRFVFDKFEEAEAVAKTVGGYAVVIPALDTAARDERDRAKADALRQQFEEPPAPKPEPTIAERVRKNRSGRGLPQYRHDQIPPEQVFEETQRRLGEE